MASVDALLKNPNAEKIFLLTLSPYNLDTSAVEDLYISNLSFSTKPTDTPASVQFIPVLDKIPNFSRSIQDVLAGQTVIDLGDLLIPDDGRLDDWMGRSKYIWSGYEYDLKIGGKGFDFSEFETILKGIMLDIEYEISRNRRFVRIVLGGNDVFLQQKLVNPNTYSSPPNTNLENKNIPVCFGFVENIQPDIYDESLMIYQFNDGSQGESEDVVMVYDQNVEVTLTGDAQSATNTTIVLDSNASSNDDEYNDTEITITAGTGSGQKRIITDYDGSTKTATIDSAWTTNPDGTSDYQVDLFVKDLVNGRFTLIDNPTSLNNITADIKGLKDAGGTYMEDTASIIKFILTQIGLSSGQIDSTTFSSFPNSDPVSGYFSRETKADEAIQWFLKTTGAAGGRNRLGEYQLIRLDTPVAPADITLTESQIFSIKRESFKPPVNKVKVGYRQNYTLNTSIPSDNAATDERKAFVQTEFRAVSADATDVSNFPLAEEPELRTTGFSTVTGAQNEADRLADIFEHPSDIFTVTATLNPLKRSLGDVVNVKIDAYDLKNGALMRIVGINPNITDNTRVTLTLWRLTD